MEDKELLETLLSVHKKILELKINNHQDIQKSTFLNSIPKKVSEKIKYTIEDQNILINDDSKQRIDFFIMACPYLSYRSLNILISEDLLEEQKILKLTSDTIMQFNKAGKKTISEIMDLKKSLLKGDNLEIVDMSQFVSQDAVAKLEGCHLKVIDDILNIDVKSLDLNKIDLSIINEIKRILSNDNAHNMYSIFDIWKNKKSIKLIDLLQPLLNKSAMIMFLDGNEISGRLKFTYPKISGKIEEIIKEFELNDIHKLVHLAYEDIDNKYKLTKTYDMKIKYLIVDKIIVKSEDKIIYASPINLIINKFKGNILKTRYEKIYISFVKYIDKIIEGSMTFKEVQLLMINQSFIKQMRDFKKGPLYGYEIFMNIYNNHKLFSYSDLENEYNKIVVDTPMNEIVDMLIKQEVFVIDENNIINIKSRKIENIVKYMDNEKEKFCFSQKLSGKTLDDIGLEIGVTRERVRQIIEKSKENLPENIFEDRYRYIFETYDLSKQEFENLLKVEPIEYNYLLIRYDKGEKNIELLLEDENLQLDDFIINRIREYINKDYIIIDDEKIKKNKYAILMYLIKYFCKDFTKIEDLFELYHDFITEFKLKDNLVVDNKQSFENTIERVDNCVNYPRKCVKYYPFFKFDWDKFYDELKIEDYMDKEISALALYKSNIELMNEFEIADYSELHNIMRRTEGIHSLPIVMKRTPHIEIGKIDFNNQVLELLIELSPIKQSDFVEKFCEKYGFNGESLMANSELASIEKYLQNGTYHIDNSYLSDIDMAYLESLLNIKQLYFVDDIKKYYLHHNGNELLATEYVFKQLGYKMMNSYIFPDNFSSMKDYLTQTIFNQEIVNIKNLAYRIKNLSAFRSFTQKMIEEMRYVEFETDKFISTKRLDEYGMDQQAINQFINNLVDQLEENKIYDLQTILLNLEENIFDTFGFGLRFYESLFRRDKENRRIHSLSIGGTLLVRKNEKIVSFIDLLQQIIDEYRSFDINDLIYYLKEEYNINTHRSFILEKVKESDLYFNDIMEKIYIDSDYYYEELD